MKQIMVMLVIGGLLTLMGCAGAAQGGTGKSAIGETKLQVTGKYVNIMASTVSIELKEDGTFTNRFGKRSSQGKYVVKGNHVIFTTGPGKTGQTFEFVLEGDSLMSKEGARFKKE
ncbi:DUF4923 family protein [Geobacter sp. AOG2]|uniref:DUF4923 family protein n=1 Tax=Geobacter sp. AOG2 TaxID=1566347 RepID=UPI001CC4CA91|nr:DUF4923 family protein [Geobacter sp. AOG2]GFE62756.1 hypothetical protein AOG2_33440 [Geobacter sp. AOG2]